MGIVSDRPPDSILGWCTLAVDTILSCLTIILKEYFLTENEWKWIGARGAISGSPYKALHFSDQTSTCITYIQDIAPHRNVHRTSLALETIRSIRDWVILSSLSVAVTAPAVIEFGLFSLQTLTPDFIEGDGIWKVGDTGRQTLFLCVWWYTELEPLMWKMPLSPCSSLLLVFALSVFSWRHNTLDFWSLCHRFFCDSDPPPQARCSLKLEKTVIKCGKSQSWKVRSSLKFWQYMQYISATLIGASDKSQIEYGKWSMSREISRSQRSLSRSFSVVVAPACLQLSHCLWKCEKVLK